MNACRREPTITFGLNERDKYEAFDHPNPGASNGRRRPALPHLARSIAAASRSERSLV